MRVEEFPLTYTLDTTTLATMNEIDDPDARIAFVAEFLSEEYERRVVSLDPAVESGSISITPMPSLTVINIVWAGN